MSASANDHTAWLMNNPTKPVGAFFGDLLQHFVETDTNVAQFVIDVAESGKPMKLIIECRYVAVNS